MKIKDPTPLLSDWKAPEIIDRKEQIKRLKELCINHLLDERIHGFIFIYGPSGSGKTFVTRKLIEDNYDSIKRHLPNFDYFYINMGDYEVPSTFSLWSTIAFNLRKYLPIKSSKFGLIEDIPLRGWAHDDYLDVVKEIVKKKNLTILVVIDEINKMVEKAKSPEILYKLSQVYTEFREYSSYVGLCFIGISNDFKLYAKLEDRIRDRFFGTIHFSDYNFSDLLDILKLHARYSLEEGSYTDEDLVQVVKKVFETSTSARRVKKVLYHLALLSEGDKLDITLLDKAMNEMRKDFLMEIIYSLPYHQKLALKSVLVRHEYLKKIKKIKRRGISRFVNTLPTRDSIYSIYTNLCKEVGEKPKTYRTYFDMIDELERKGLVRLGIVHSKGMTTIVNPVDPDLIKLLVERSLE